MAPPFPPSIPFSSPITHGRMALSLCNQHPLSDSPKTPLLHSPLKKRQQKHSSEEEEEEEDEEEHLEISLAKSLSTTHFKITPSRNPSPEASDSYRSIAVISGHMGSVSCLALCGEFLLSASQGKDIRVWQQPDLRHFTRFGHGDGAVKALVTVGTRIFTAHQDSRIRVWKISRDPENVFKLIATMPTPKDYLSKFMKQSNYVQSRRNHKHLWIEHADSISCLAVSQGLIYSGSWDKTLKVWKSSDLRCIESIRAHDDAINGLVAHGGLVYSASADGKIKVWGKKGKAHSLCGVLQGHKEMSMNAVVVCEQGKWVYGGGSDGNVMGWEGGLDEWNLVCDFRAHSVAVLCLCLAGGEILCSGSADRSIRIWRRGFGGGLCSVGVVRGHEGPVRCLQASSLKVGQGFLLYSGSLDKSLRVWWVSKEQHFLSRSGVLGEQRGDGELKFIRAGNGLGGPVDPILKK
ncbi:hypothetical protein AMTRI_Chr01g109030 [Amborella trichopoda]